MSNSVGSISNKHLCVLTSASEWLTEKEPSVTFCLGGVLGAAIFIEAPSSDHYKVFEKFQ